MTTPLLPFPIFRAFDTAGNPLAGGLVYTYAAGTLTPKATYSDAAGGTPNSNPVVLDSTGTATIRLGSGAYKFIINDSSGNLQDSVDNYSASYLTGADVGELLYPRTAAEIAASVTPTNYGYPESDIRRYGALTAASDNAAAINNALLVSANGGSAAFIPPGNWKHTSTLNATLNSSMYGIGTASTLAPQDVDGITFGAGTIYSTTTGNARFFRDFQIINSNSTNSTKRGIVIDFTAASGSRVTGVNFQNLYIDNFGTGAYLRGLWGGNWDNCFFYNCYYGLYFNGQNIQAGINGCYFVRGTITGAGGSWGISFQSTAGETTQSTQIYGTYTYGFERGINAVLVLELQIEHCDISQNLDAGIVITTTLGGVWVRDCWVEANTSAATYGIKVSDLATANFGDIHIVGNHVVHSLAASVSGSIGIYAGFNQVAVSILDNYVYNFDKGIDTSAISGSTVNYVIKHNRINSVTSVYSATSFAIQLHSNCGGSEVGPNYIKLGAVQAATMTGASANIGVPDSTLFPVNTPVQFDATQNGFTIGVTYFVLTSAANVITVAPAAGGTAIVATGAVAVNVMQAPLQLRFNSGSPAGLKFFGTGAFIITLTGFAANVLGVVKWACDGSKVTLDASTSSIFGTSTTNAMTGTGVPAVLSPPTARGFPSIILNNSVRALGYSTLTGTTITFSADMAAAVFTAANNKGVSGEFASWNLL
jgi:hypothetical protein